MVVKAARLPSARSLMSWGSVSGTEGSSMLAKYEESRSCIRSLGGFLLKDKDTSKFLLDNAAQRENE
jgi:hypothetical protein